MDDLTPTPNNEQVNQGSSRVRLPESREDRLARCLREILRAIPTWGPESREAYGESIAVAWAEMEVGKPPYDLIDAPSASTDFSREAGK